MEKNFSLRGMVSVLVVLLAWSLPAFGQIAGPPDARYVEGQVIVGLHPSAGPSYLQGVRSTLNASVKRVFPSIRGELWELEGFTVTDAIRLLENDPAVRYVEPNYIGYADGIPNDARFSELWGMHNTGQTGGTPDADIDAPEAWEIETGGEVIIGVLDSGVDWTHVDLAANIYENPGEIAGNGIDDDANGYIDDIHGWDFANDDNNPMDDHGHGTHCSGTIAGQGNNGVGVAGVCWSAKILPIKWITAAGSGTEGDVIAAIEYATMMGARVTSNSWWFPYSLGLKDAIEAAGNAGFLFISSAGNNSADTDITPQYPACYDLDNIITVASTTHTDAKSSFSNYGLLTVDLGAPGSDILSCLPGNTYGLGSGTSMAVPHVAGAVGLIWSAAPNMNRDEVKAHILSTVDPISSMAGRTVSGGRLNVFNMLSGLDSIPPDPVTDLAVVSTSSNTVTLTWTASGDDTTAGTARRYDLRYALSDIAPGNWDQATPVPGVPEPKPAGTAETFEVAGLDFTTTYYFGLVAVDEQENESPLSNVPSGTTLGIPTLAYDPPLVSDDLFTGETATQVLTVTNTGEGTLDFVFPEALPADSAVSAPPVIPAWLRVDPASGRVESGENTEIALTFDAFGLGTGTYTHGLVLETNDPSHPTVTVFMTLTVTSAPDIRVSRDAIDWGLRFTGTSTPDTLVVSNLGVLDLVVTGITIDDPEFTTDPSAFLLTPGQSRPLTVTFSPVSLGSIAGTLSIQSNDPGFPAKNVSLSGIGADPPVVSVTPDSIPDDLYTGETSAHTLTIDNAAGGSDLVWSISARHPEDTAAVLETSPVFASVPFVDENKDRHAPRSGPADPGQVFAFSGTRMPTASSQPEGAETPLESILASLDARYASVTGTIPNRFDFSEGETGFFISDGDLDMYDQGNYLSTDLGGYLDYSDGVIASSAYLGSGGKYFTRKYPGLFVLAVDMNGVDYFDISGNLGADGIGAVDGAVLSAQAAGMNFYGFVKRVYNAGDPSVNHLIIIEEHPAANHTFATNTDDDYHRVVNLTGVKRLYYVLYAGTNGHYIDNNATLAIMQNFLSALGLAPEWVRMDPLSGTVPPGGNAIVDVTFDAYGLNGGDYDANLLVASNDPVHPEVRVAAHLHVTGAPDIAVSETSFDFGPLFIGAVAKDTLVVSNVGTDVLDVSDVSLDEAQYAVDVTSFSLAPGERRDVEVTFAPATAAPIPGTLTITSNDPDTPVVVVTLAGEGLEPPVVAVDPDSMADSLFTGESSTHTLTISNTGGNDLVWRASLRPREEPATKTYALTAPAAGKVDPETGKAGAIEDFRTTPISADLADLTDVHILWDRVHGQYEVLNWSVIMADLTARGATVTESFETITTALLEEYDLLWTSDFSTPWAPSEIQAVEDWVLVGGALLFESDESQDGINALISGLGSGIEYLFTPAESGVTTAIYPHETTRDVSAVYVDNPLASLGVDEPAGLLVDDTGANHVVAFSEVGRGRIVAASDELWGDWSVGLSDNQLFGNQAVDWLVVGVDWLALDPAEGTVAPGGSEEVDVTFDATGLFGGEYDAHIVVASNDPVDPEALVPAHLHVTGAPDIVVSETLIDFGQIFVGATAARTLVVTNEGTDVLDVSDVTLDDGQYAVDATSFSLDPGESRDVEVTFAPAAAAPIPGTLTITSNDPDTPVIMVTLAGEGLEPPVISVAPDTLADSLFTGGNSTHALTVSNNGGSDLVFRITSEAAGSAADSLAVLIRSGREQGETQPSAASNLDHRNRYAEVAGADPDADYRHEPLPAADPEIARLYRSLQSTFAESTLIFFDDMESGVNGWTHYPTHGSTVDLWNQSTERSSSGVTSWRVSQHDYEGADALASPPIDLRFVPAATLVFQQWYNFDDCDDPTFESDGAILEISTDAGATWTQIFPVGGYPYTLDDVCDNPLAYYDAYCHDGGDGNLFVPAVFDISGYAGSVVSIRFHAGWDCGNCGSNEGWYIDDVAVYARGVGWLWATPSAGTVPPGGTLDVEATFDATGLFGGDYAGNLVVGSNDPIAPEVRVAALLHVTGAPDIQISQTTIDYGPVFNGAVVKDTLVVSNEGAEVLDVTDLSVDEAQYAVDVTSFSLAPGEGREVEVTFAPVTAGPVPGNLTITCNDPDEPVNVVTLAGEGVEPPVIAVSPDSLADSLFVGDVSTQLMTIQNLGAYDLTFNITIEELSVETAVRAVRIFTPDDPSSKPWKDRTPESTSPPGPARDASSRWDGKGAPAQPPAETAHRPIRVVNVAGTALRLLLVHTADVSQIQSDLLSFPDIETVDVFDASVATPTLATLLDYDAAILIANSLFADPIALGDVLADYVDEGGGVIMTVASFIDMWAVQGRFRSGGYYPFTLGAGPVGPATLGAYDASHPIMAGVTAAWGDLLGVTSVAPGAQWVADWSIGQPLVATQGDRVVGVNSFLSGGSSYGDDVPLILHNAASWTTGLAWLSADPKAGVIPPDPGSAVDVEITFDATRLTGGDYDAHIVIANNDPLNPEVRVPAHLHVTGVPDIVVSEALIDFGPVFVGGAAKDTLIVSNTGTGVLDVSDVSIDDTQYTVNVTAFSIATGESLGVEITFAPAAAGPIPGTLTITSNDPDEPAFEVALDGDGITPPVFGISCESLSDSLPIGDTSAHACTIDNSGGVELTWSASIEYDGDTRGVLDSSPVFASTHVVDQSKDAASEPAGRPDPSQLFAFAARGGAPEAPGSLPGLEMVLANLNTRWADLISAIPVRFDFAEGETGNSIVEGGQDMYDGGNYLATDLGGFLDYSNNAIVDSPYFGTGGRYFTRKYPGLFVMAADLHGVGHFEITGDLGADGVGAVDGAVLEMSVAGTNFYGFLKRVYAAADPSVNHLIIIEEDPSASHEFATNTNDDYHRVFNLAGVGRIYYLLFAGTNGRHFEDSEVMGIMRAFVDCAKIVPQWLHVAPLAGVVAPGETMGMGVTFDATGLLGGEHDAEIVMTSNDPVTPEVRIPAHLRVIPSSCGTPDILSCDPAVVTTSNCAGGCTVEFLVDAPDGYTGAAKLTLERFREGMWVVEDSVLVPPQTPTWTLSCEFDEHYTDGEHTFRTVLHCNEGSKGVSDVMTVLADRGVPVLFQAFEPSWSQDGVVLRWNVGGGESLAGFNVYRSGQEETGFERINAEIIPAREGNEYTDTNTQPGATYWYRLGAVDSEGEWLSPTVSISVPAVSLALHQNVPNPFNPTTSISFALPERSRATLSVYDVEGRHVKTLVDEVFEAGVRKAEWDGTDARGNRVGSGMYFYRLTVGGKSLTKKMILLK